MSAQGGSVTAELALYLPVAILLFAGLFEFGSGIFGALRLESAARAGAQYAMADPNNTANIQDAVRRAIGADATGVTVTATTFCECPGNSAQVDCSTATCSGGQAVRTYVSIDATQPFAPLLTVPGLAPVNQLSGHAVIRVR
jgi:Flp pilus assembly protein TadG